MKLYLFDIIIVIIILVSTFSSGYYYGRKVNIVDTKLTIVTIVDTILVLGKATILYLTIYVLTIIDNNITQIDTVFITLTDTIMSIDTIACIDTTFTSLDLTIKSLLNIKYSYNEQSFWIKNILTHKHKLIISYVDNSNIDNSKFNRFGISTYVIDNNIGLGLHYHLSNNLCLGFGYDNNDNIMAQIQFNF